jgi:PAS domain S-box-containing protein
MDGPGPAESRNVTPPVLSEAVMRRLLHASPDALVVVDAQGMIVFSNEQAERLFGWTRAALQGRLLETLVPDQLAVGHASLRTGFALQPAARPMGAGRELHAKRSDGSEFPAEISLSAIGDGNGSVLVLAAVRDVSERLQLEVGRREKANEAESERRLRLGTEQLLHELASNIEVGFALRALDPPEFQYLNAAYFRIFGFDPNGDIPTPADVMAIIHPDDVAELSGVIPDVGPGKQSRHEWRIVRPDGSHRWIGGTISPITDDDGVVRRVAGIFEDLTERKALDQARREAEVLLKEFANSTELGMFVRDSNRVLYANAGIFRMLGLDPETTPTEQLDFRPMIHPEDRAAAQEVAALAMDERRSTSIDMRIVRPDGSVRWVRTTNNPVAPGDDGVPRVAITVVDITERMEAAASERSARLDAEQANAAKDDFLSRMSHELRTPLNAILGFAQVLQLTERNSEALDEVVAAGRHLLALVDELLDAAWMKPGAVHLSLEPVRPVDVVGEAVAMLRPLATVRDVNIAIGTGDELADDVHVYVDRQRLKQVMVNLLANAVKYNRDGGTVRVGAEVVDGGRVRLTVTDTGFGIAEDDQALLFQPFERLSAHASAVEGTGLGLAVSQQLVTAMEGAIGMSSTVGVGSEFWVELPIASAPTVQLESDLRRLSEIAPSATGLRSVLYIEDNISNLRLMQRILDQRPGVVLTVAERGRRGLELAISTSPELILLDLHLPDLSGQEVLSLLRSNPVTAGIPVVVLSADAQPGHRARLMAAGATDYVTKPFDVAQLLGVIDRTHDARRAITTVAIEEADSVVESDQHQPPVDPKSDMAVRMLTFVHDLNNQLGVILSLCELMTTSARDSSFAADLEGIRVAAQRAVTMAAALTPNRSGSDA